MLTKDITSFRHLPLPAGKRLFDLTLAAFLILPISALMLMIGSALLLTQGGPILHRSKRLARGHGTFRMLKFRTMHPGTPEVPGGAHLVPNITPMGQILRSKRLDELPQIWNVIRGDMSFVGPRPVLHSYAAWGVPAPTLTPGITGLTILTLHRAEARILAEAETAATAETLYRRRLLPRYRTLDLIYARRRTLWLDLWLIARTARVVFG